MGSTIFAICSAPVPCREKNSDKKLLCSIFPRKAITVSIMATSILKYLKKNRISRFKMTVIANMAFLLLPFCLDSRYAPEKSRRMTPSIIKI